MLQLGEEGRRQRSPKGSRDPGWTRPVRKTSWFIALGMLSLSMGGTGGGWGGDGGSVPPPSVAPSSDCLSHVTLVKGQRQTPCQRHSAVTAPLVTSRRTGSLLWEQDTIAPQEHRGGGGPAAAITLGKHHGPQSPAATGEQDPG